MNSSPSQLPGLRTSTFQRPRRCRRLLGLAALVLGAVGSLPAATVPSDKEAPPDRVLVERAEKIVSKLQLPDAAQAGRIRDAVARHYSNLQKLQAEHEAAMATAGADKAAVEAAKTDAKLRTLEVHYAFLGRLGAELTPAQVDQVKDGLTYGVLPLTYQVYQDMVPTLTDEQKRQILAWLIEAREHAMDGGSSEEKHRWFGKYKGRINNYLSAAGIDLKQAERDMRERQKAAKQKAGS